MQTCKAALDGYTEMEVRNCLNAESAARASIKSTEIKDQMEYCKNALKRHNNKGSFSSTFQQRFTQVLGGCKVNTTDLLFSTNVKPATLNKWKNTLKINPEVISYSLYPLYLLVNDPVKKKGVKKATQDYILQHALQHQIHHGQLLPSAARHGPLHCNCQTCHRPMGWLMGNQTFQTKIIKGDNNPKWNKDFYLGTVELPLKTKLTIEVWDEDDHWYDQTSDLLVSCTKSVEAGSFTFVCPMNHSNEYFSYKVECAPWLGGDNCSHYRPFRMKADLLDLYLSHASLNETHFMKTESRIIRLSNETSYTILVHCCKLSSFLFTLR